MGGWLGWTENHPFTIASIPNTENGLFLMCRQTGTVGSWTTRLFDLAKASGYEHNERGKAAVDMDVLVMVEGPYGGPGYIVYANYSAAIFFCGGSGISFGLSTIQDLVQRDLEGTSRIRFVELIWVVQDPASLVPLISLFNDIIQRSFPKFLNISVFYTRATAGVEMITKECDRRMSLSLNAGRPKIGQTLDSVISRATSIYHDLGGDSTKDPREKVSGVIVGVCGPSGLGDEVSEAVRVVDDSRRKAVGGLELYEEIFSL